MRLNELFDQESFGKPTSSPKEVANKHNVTLDDILSQLKKGIKIEQEHTQDRTMAKEIALDHLAEFPDYYDRLEDVESVKEDVFTKAVNFAKGKILSPRTKEKILTLKKAGHSFHEIAAELGLSPRKAQDIFASAGLDISEEVHGE